MTTINVGSDSRSRRATNNGPAEFIRGPELARLNILPRHDIFLFRCPFLLSIA